VNSKNNTFLPAAILFCINQHMTFEVLRFTDFKDTIGGQNSKTGHVTLTIPIRVVYYYFLAHWYFISRGIEIKQLVKCLEWLP